MFTSVEGGEIHGGECEVNITLTKGVSIIKLEIDIEGHVDVECDRCLEDVSVPVEYSGTLIVKITPTTRDTEFVIDDKAEDTMLVNPGIDILDLEEYLHDSIILSIPLQRVHEENEDGVSGCNPDMLSRFTTTSDEWDLDEDDEEEDDDDL